MKHLRINEAALKTTITSLSSAFVWGESEEGHSYWQEVQRKLIDIRDQDSKRAVEIEAKTKELRQLEQWFKNNGLQIPERW